MQTQQGLDVSTNSIDVINSINHFHQQILSSGQNAGLILDAARDNPDNVLIQTYAAIYYLYAQEDEATGIAESYLKMAAKHLKSANQREHFIYQAALCWSRLEYTRAIHLLAKIIELFPRDTLSLKFLEWLLYCTGQAYQAEFFLRICNLCAAENQNESHFLAIHSFALELCGNYHQAREMAERAIGMDLLTPWAHHTLAHVYLMNHQMDEGIKQLQILQSSWDVILPLLKGHNTWHLALFHLANRKEEETLKLYPQIFGTLPNTVLEQLDSISLLWRMDMAGFPQVPLLNQVISHLGTHPLEYYTGFSSAHFIYCLVRTGHKKEADESLKKMKLYAESDATLNLWNEIIIPLCHGIYAFADGNYKLACQLMEPVINKSAQLGGSDAQIELFSQAYLTSLLHEQKQSHAVQFFMKNLAHYQNTALADYWFTSGSMMN